MQAALGVADIVVNKKEAQSLFHHAYIIGGKKK